MVQNYCWIAEKIAASLNSVILSLDSNVRVKNEEI